MVGWRIYYVDTSGNVNGTDVMSFTIGGETNTPPETPSRPSGVGRGITDRRYVYTTRTTDPEGDFIYYRWDWGDGSYSDWLGPYGSGLIAGAQHKWTSGGAYQIRVKAKDQYGAESDWSDPLTVSIHSIKKDKVPP